ncbi:thioredoxin-dependent thiol peroxidase [Roseivirga sp. E12]|uniref:thioredoxin-dependent thiol peroxidase n=1 Tax=Roseivirga sp. E12 TaxID=2819237 RepID=UPI001ABC37AA|nr:thioredoxin-dependent thiol peroxidase [Roseivirga sp. E12]MBO3696870.1 thioredoxin-dependent thiol peroxidase [Roseivirga sp. E12]
MALQVGDKAPAFEGIDQDSNPIKLSDFSGKKLVLYFYPKDNTPGCTAQSCNLRDNYDALLKAGYAVVGISSDSAKKHQNFIAKYELPFPLIADEDKSIHEQFGTWVEKSMYGRTYMGTARTTFVINESGVIEEIIAKVKTKDHTAQILD